MKDEGTRTARKGPGAPILVLHSAGLDGRSANFIQMEWIIAPTLPGHGPGAATEVSLAEMVDVAVGAVDGPVDVVGLSLGGMVAQHFALEHPELVRSLVLACTAAQTNTELMLDRAEHTAAAPRDELMETTLRRWFTADALQGDLTPGVAHAIDALKAIDQDTFAGVWRAIATHDTVEVLDRVTVPTTCVAGVHDVSTPPAALQQLTDLISGSRYREIDAPHMAHLEQPKSFSAVLREHLEWVDRQS